MKTLQGRLEIRRIFTNTEEYTDEIALRDRGLRRPLNMSIYNDDLSGEKNDYHIGAFLGGKLVGTLFLTRVDQNRMKIRQVIVEEKYRHMHIGAKMMEYAQLYAFRRGCREVVLDARKTAVPFYEKLGFVKDGAEFTEVGLPHLKMKKSLSGLRSF